MSAPFDIFASCAPGLEPLLKDELAGLGALGPSVVPGGVSARGHRRVVYRINLESGLATHVLVRVGGFVAERLDALEREIAALPWERFLERGVPRALRASAKKSRLHHTGAIIERAARGIAMRLGDDRVEHDPDGVPVAIRFDHDRALVSVDTSGAPLHRRGYRLDVAEAPLREDLARALVIASGWDRTTPLVDPFCGAGTIPIEAAMLARGLAAGRLRGFAFERGPLFDEATFRAVRDAAIERAFDRAPAPIVGGDRDARAIAAATRNAERAGVSEDLALATASVSELDLSAVARAERGVLIANPPYGHRLGTPGELTPLYRALGRRAKDLPAGWRIAVITSERRLAMHVSPHLRTAFVTQSGGLTVRALIGPA